MGTTVATTKRNVKVKEFGLTELVCDRNPIVDIIFVHGLNGSSYNTWATKKPEVYWPSDLLPQALSGLDVRILTYGYNANVSAFMDGVSKDKLHNHAEHLAGSLVANRNIRGAAERPIIFVAHSLGGLVVKKALTYCSRLRHQHTQHLRSIYISTYGILFLGTPHNGSDIAKLGGMLQSIYSAVLPKKFFDSSPHLIQTLKTDNEHLQNINRDFVQITDRFRIYFFHESKPMDLKGVRAFIVDESSAAPVIDGVERMGIEADHGAMCRFQDENAPGYEAVIEAIYRYASEGVPVISSRWSQEHRERENERKEAARRLYGITDSVVTLPSDKFDTLENSLASLVGTEPSIPSKPQSILNEMRQEPEKSEFIMITPPGFHPNSVFFGMDDELKQLHSMLSNERKRSIGSVVVLIHAGPGAGKSHLAREYMYNNLPRYPGGVFWIDGRTKESRLNGIWEIALSASVLAEEQACRDSKWLRADLYSQNVKEWLERKENWLLIFDGLSFEQEEDINDFKDFLPFKKNTSIIFTSVDRTLSQKQRLFEPFGLKVKPLAVRDARKLLFNDLGISRPNREQIRKATELVKYFECLPLAIHALGHRLGATRKPLEKYRVESHLTDQRLAEPYQGIMADLQINGYVEALNLINILSFFGHHVPVGMIFLGRKALADYNVEIRTIEREGSSQRHIDSTFGILIKYGLIERSFDPYPLNELSGTPTSELDTQERRSLSSDAPNSNLSGSQEPYPNSLRSSIDIVKIHTVVQGFCRDELTVQGSEHFCFWLTVATGFFCASYAGAIMHIKATGDSGLVRDYREYKTHAKRLLHHFPTKLTRTAMFLQTYRERLVKITEDIEEEIQNRSPDSSQESLRNQKSIFDHTSSMSSVSDSATGESFQFIGESDVDRQNVDSPVDMDSTQRPQFSSKDVCNIPHHGKQRQRKYKHAEDDDEDDDDGDKTVQMSPSLSHGTEVPTPKISQQGDEKKPKVTKKKVQKTKLPSFFESLSHRIKGRKNLGQIEPTAAVSVFDVCAEASSTRDSDEPQEKSVQAKSYAETLLAAVHHTSPPPSRGRGAKTVNRESLSKENRLTYADVLESQPHTEARSSTVREDWPSLQGGESSTHDQHGSLYLSTDGFVEDKLALSTHSDPGLPYPSIPSQGLDVPPSHSMPHSRHKSTSSDFSRANYPNYGDAHIPHRPQGANLEPLPYDSNVEITQLPRRGARANNRGLARNVQELSFPTLYPASSHGAMPMPTFTAGHSPQPMSRDHSQQSTQSLHSEPGRYPTKFSPMAGNRASSFSHTSRNIDPRIGTRPDQRIMFGPGESAIDSDPSTPASLEAPPLSKTSSGPGIMVNSGYGMSKSLVEFDAVPYTEHIRFGDIETVDVDAARERSAHPMEQTGLQGTGYSHPENLHPPYPNQNLMPTASDPGQLEHILAQQRVGQLRGQNTTRRTRRGSVPVRPDRNGLGIRHRL